MQFITSSISITRDLQYIDQNDLLEAAGEGTKMADHLSAIFRPAFPSSAIISERSASVPPDRLASPGAVEGDLTQRARQRASQIARDADLRTVAPRDFFSVGSADNGYLERPCVTYVRPAL
jgi:Tfp pilus assembly protein FimV